MIEKELENYIDRHTQKECDVLSQLTRATHQRILRPRMLSGNAQGQLLKMLCKMLGARRVLELGTFTGYSAISMAQGMPKDGILHTIDNNDEIADFTQEYIEKAGLSDKIICHIGEACDIIKHLDEQWDMIFIDADKREYPQYYNLLIDKLRSGGIIAADDVLWDGKVVDPCVISNPDAQTQGILDFNTMVQNDERVENVLLPLRHGLMLVRKK